MKPPTQMELSFISYYFIMSFNLSTLNLILSQIECFEEQYFLRIYFNMKIDRQNMNLCYVKKHQTLMYIFFLWNIF